MVDAFSRKLWVDPLTSKDPLSVPRSLTHIFSKSGWPHQITTDMGKEFTGKPMTDFLNHVDVVHVTNNPAAVNTLAVVDRAIGKYKSILHNLLTKQGGTWSDYVQKAAEIFNDRPNAHLYNSSPNDVKGNNVLEYELEAEAGVDMKQNYDKWVDRMHKLRQKGGVPNAPAQGAVGIHRGA